MFHSVSEGFPGEYWFLLTVQWTRRSALIPLLNDHIPGRLLVWCTMEPVQVCETVRRVCETGLTCPVSMWFVLGNAEVSSLLMEYAPRSSSWCPALHRCFHWTCSSQCWTSALHQNHWVLGSRLQPPCVSLLFAFLQQKNTLKTKFSLVIQAKKRRWL